MSARRPRSASRTGPSPGRTAGTAASRGSSNALNASLACAGTIPAGPPGQCTPACRPRSDETGLDVSPPGRCGATGAGRMQRQSVSTRPPPGPRQQACRPCPGWGGSDLGHRSRALEMPGSPGRALEVSQIALGTATPAYRRREPGCGPAGGFGRVPDGPGGPVPRLRGATRDFGRRRRGSGCSPDRTGGPGFAGRSCRAGRARSFRVSITAGRPGAGVRIASIYLVEPVPVQSVCRGMPPRERPRLGACRSKRGRAPTWSPAGRVSISS